MEMVSTALYARGKVAEIEQQLSFLKNYIDHQEELILTECFTDAEDSVRAGASATEASKNPEFDRMLELAKRGEISCILVQSFSIFLADALEIGYYIETIFPLLDIRMIALEENFDSIRLSDRESFSERMRELSKASRGKVISRKRAETLKKKKALGLYELPVAPYGYQFLGEEKKLTADPRYAPYVKMVFAWTLAGIGRSEIARRFQLMGVPTPAQAMAERGLKIGAHNQNWNAHTIKGILQNPIYSGCMVMGKTRKSVAEGLEDQRIGREHWTILPNMHEPLVSKQDYQVIEEMVEKNREEKQKRKQRAAENRRVEFEDCFCRLVFCGECGRPMPFTRGVYQYKGTGTEGIYSYYRCISRKKVSRCKNQKIQQNFLKLVVMQQISDYIHKYSVQKNQEKMMWFQQGSLEKGLPGQSYVHETSSERSFFDMEKLEADFKQGILEAKEYQLLREQMILDAQRLEEERQYAAQRHLDTEKAVWKFVSRVEELERNLERSRAEEDFFKKLVKELVQRVCIYEDNRVEVLFYQDEILENPYVQEYLEGMK